jgi:hypothetical protein
MVNATAAKTSPVWRSDGGLTSSAAKLSWKLLDIARDHPKPNRMGSWRETIEGNYIAKPASQPADQNTKLVVLMALPLIDVTSWH